MTVLEAIKKSAEYLERRGIESARLQSELLLAALLGMPRLKLYLNFELRLTPDQIDRLRSHIVRRGSREPLQHIVGSTSFCGLEIAVNREVLVPRPETEVLAEQGWLFLKQRSLAHPIACDFGTGSGCIAIALATQIPGLNVWAIDRSRAALETAAANARNLHVADRIRFVEGSTVRVLGEGVRFDLIVSNPPYIRSGDIPTLQPEVRDFDPRLALDGGEDGLECFRLLAGDAGQFLSEGGRMMVELGDDQDVEVEKVFVSSGWLVESRIPDLSGRIRVLTLRSAGG